MNKRALVNEMLVNEVYPCAEHYEVEEEGDVDTINVANRAAWQSYSLSLKIMLVVLSGNFY